MTNAFVQAELLSEEIGGDLNDSVRVDAALSRFASRRQDVFIDGYQSTLETARLRVQSSRLKMLRSDWRGCQRPGSATSLSSPA